MPPSSPRPHLLPRPPSNPPKYTHAPSSRTQRPTQAVQLSGPDHAQRAFGLARFKSTRARPMSRIPQPPGTSTHTHMTHQVQVLHGRHFLQRPGQMPGSLRLEANITLRDGGSTCGKGMRSTNIARWTLTNIRTHPHALPPTLSCQVACTRPHSHSPTRMRARQHAPRASTGKGQEEMRLPPQPRPGLASRARPAPAAVIRRGIYSVAGPAHSLYREVPGRAGLNHLGPAELSPPGSPERRAGAQLGGGPGGPGRGPGW